MDPSEQMKIFVRIVELRQIAFGKHLNCRFCFLSPQKPYLSKARTQRFGMIAWPISNAAEQHLTQRFKVVFRESRRVFSSLSTRYKLANKYDVPSVSTDRKPHVMKHENTNLGISPRGHTNTPTVVAAEILSRQCTSPFPPSSRSWIYQLQPVPFLSSNPPSGDSQQHDSIELEGARR